MLLLASTEELEALCCFRAPQNKIEGGFQWSFEGFKKSKLEEIVADTRN